MKSSVKAAIITLIVANILFYIWLPPINLTSMNFWTFVFVIYYVFIISKNFSSLFDTKVRTQSLRIDKNFILYLLPFAMFFLIFVINFICSPVFNSRSYSRRITIDETADFTEDVTEVNFNSIPLLDKESSQKLGDRVMGQLPELVSQFYVSNLYTQINYNEDIIRVTPLEYAGFFKYLSNRKDGIKGYITVNSVDGDANLIKLDNGVKYTTSAYFFENLSRHIRYEYPTLIFGDESFEIDNEGNPYWIVPIMGYTGISIKTEIKGVLIVNAVTGEITKYKVEEVPTWVDHVYSASLVIEQVDDWGKYRNGYFNTLFSQKNVVATTDGYNYIALNDDIYLYTGITSIEADEANIGFILTNLRTKETKFYSVPGAEEYSAMASAEGQVQQMKYTATFPLLINLDGRPTYLISLKDNAGLVKMYAFVDVEDYQKVSVSDATIGIEKASQVYLESNFKEIQSDKLLTKEIVISSLTLMNIDGTSYYYIIDENKLKYKVSIKTNEEIIPFLKKGDKIKVWFKQEKVLTEIVKVESNI